MHYLKVSVSLKASSHLRAGSARDPTGSARDVFGKWALGVLISMARTVTMNHPDAIRRKPHRQEETTVTSGGNALHATAGCLLWGPFVSGRCARAYGFYQHWRRQEKTLPSLIRLGSISPDEMEWRRTQGMILGQMRSFTYHNQEFLEVTLGIRLASHIPYLLLNCPYHV